MAVAWRCQVAEVRMTMAWEDSTMVMNVIALGFLICQCMNCPTLAKVYFVVMRKVDVERLLTSSYHATVLMVTFMPHLISKFGGPGDG
jgi:hypothetical protein